VTKLTKYKLPVISYKGINLNKIIAIPSYGGFLSAIYKSFFTEIDFSKIDSTKDVAIIYSHEGANRPDYDDIVNTFHHALTNETADFIALKCRFSMTDKLSFLRHLFSTFMVSINFNIGFSEKLKVSFLLARAKVNVDGIEQYFKDSKFNILVTFCDAYDIDNALVQLAKKHGIITATLQHGQYHILNADVPENLALQNLISDYLLSWGEATQVESSFKCSTNTKVIPLGICSSEYSTVVPYCSDSVNEETNKKLLCIMFNADNCYEQNIEMLSLVRLFCQQKDCLFTVQFHPKNNRKRYLNSLEKEGCYIPCKENKKIFISVIYTSGILVKLLAKGERFLLYKDKSTPSLFYNSIPSFENLKELNSNFNSLFNSPSDYEEKMVRAQSFFIASGNALENHRLFINQLLGKK
jgi:hypothetical protein